ncbi:anaerobic ribonucleoside-triphosphate reductase activating protein [Patescibacteria group bacterium]|nr:anaerobic ribonucleoside-triphosphate reductase activating protein [Patescibacteria group bacterium]MBZ9578523.1 anaerobic ribonucleoside-triphosphate reductase activating protein [Patescibacteria group bacterium]
MKIGGLQKLTLIDYPGKIACTVFTIGCNFRCPWCYSAELVLPEKIKFQPKISEKEFFGFLKERKRLIGGVVICGGEPTIHEDLPKFVKKIKKLGYSVKLDTNGSNPKMLKDLIDKKLIDYVAIDIKAPKERYEKLVGRKINIKNIENSLGILKNSLIDFEFRTTIVPTLLKKEDILKIARWISEPTRLRQGFEGQGKYFLQNFRPEKTINPKFEKIKPYPQEKLIEIRNAIAPFFELCQIR